MKWVKYITYKILRKVILFRFKPYSLVKEKAD
jgi:hypothetical protein